MLQEGGERNHTLRQPCNIFSPGRAALSRKKRLCQRKKGGTGRICREPRAHGLPLPFRKKKPVSSRIFLQEKANQVPLKKGRKAHSVSWPAHQKERSASIQGGARKSEGTTDQKKKNFFFVDEAFKPYTTVSKKACSFSEEKKKEKKIHGHGQPIHASPSLLLGVPFLEEKKTSALLSLPQTKKETGGSGSYRPHFVRNLHRKAGKVGSSARSLCLLLSIYL